MLQCDGFDSPTDFQFLQFLLQALGDHSERTNNNCDPYALKFFQFSGKIRVFVNLFVFF